MISTLKNAKKILWENTKKGQEVWIEGKAHGKQCLYGPHTIYNKRKKILINHNKRTFPEPYEMLWIKEGNSNEN
jgi:hypothetical protein